MDHDRLHRQIEFIIELDRLKSVYRKSYLVDGSRRENSAEHSWHVATMALVLDNAAPENVDLLRVVRMLLLHDIVEIDAGDTDIHDLQANVDKAEREQRAADRLFALLPADQAVTLRAAWQEFEQGVTAEARFANAVDRLMPLLQSWRNQGKRWKEDGITREQVLRVFQPLSEGAPGLWQLAQSLIDQCVDRGYLPRS